MKPLKIIFMGTAEFAVPCLKKIYESPHKVVAVVTAPDLPRGRGQKVSFTPVKEFAVEHDIDIIQPGVEKGSLRDPQFIEQLKTYDADLFLVVAFRILPPEVFELPPLGSINLHGSLLPKFRGAAPINWAVMRGEKETGVTAFFIQKKVDTGNMILQKSISIGEDETAGEVHDRLSALGAEALLETVELVAAGNPPRLVQDESLVSTAPKIFKEQCRINWNLPALELKNFVRGLSPHPCAYSVIHDEHFKIYKITIDSDKIAEHLAAGTIAEIDKAEGIAVVCGDKKIVWIKEIQPPSKKKMSVQDFLRGHNVSTWVKLD
ncbi:methionyl-tRNA formyltransferase [bacterium]|nr:methionyl-tRNA formyltransferase [bacterium]